MKQVKIIILFFLLFISVDTISQSIASNFCDSSVLTKAEFDKCKIDSVWKSEVLIKINYISALKTELLPKYRQQRIKIILPTNLKSSVRLLKNIYDSVLMKKLYVFEKDMDKQQLLVQPKAYISSLLSFQVFKFYPDVYAILLNDIHLQLKPKTSTKELENYTKLFNNVLTIIPTKLYKQLEKINLELQMDKAKLNSQIPSELFRGSIVEEYRTQCNIVNLLMWTE